MNTDEIKQNGGSSYAVPGFQANGIAVGIKEGGNKDLALIYSVKPAVAAAVFTTNCFKAAPVLVDMERIKAGVAQAIVTNSGNANAANGPDGYEDALRMSRSAALHLGIDEALVLVGSTGVIGHRLPVEKIEAGMGGLVAGLHEHGIPVAEEAIMTTDRFPKMALRRSTLDGKEVTVCGMAKGAGMIEPHMATMLAYVMTDARIERAALQRILKRAVAVTFNAITVDGCMSTNDTLLVLANGMAGNRLIKGNSSDASLFEEMLTAVLSELALAMVRDGEGATKVIDISVQGAKSSADARKVASAIGNSELVKTAFYGGDPNWGRILSAAGAVGVKLPVDHVELLFEDVLVFSGGRGIEGREKTVAEIMKQDHIRVTIDLAMGSHSWRLLASDLTLDYVKINAHYHT
jgi:glutamate N-acetyltransferase/amino-acid N-acetyltransferase